MVVRVPMGELSYYWDGIVDNECRGSQRDINALHPIRK